MKNLIKVLGIIALVAVIGFSMVGCSKSSGGSSSSSRASTGGNGGGGGAGRLSITGLPSGGDWAVVVLPAGTDLSTLTACFMALANQSNFLASSDSDDLSGNVFSLNTRSGPFTGSGSLKVLLQNQNDLAHRTATVNFSNGSATVPFNSFTAVTQ